MDIKAISSVPVQNVVKGKAAASDSLSDFKNILGQSIGEIDRALGEANQTARDMVLGKKDVHEAMIATEMAGISFRLMVQIRNKMMTAYEEIMRMQF